MADDESSNAEGSESFEVETIEIDDCDLELESGGEPCKKKKKIDLDKYFTYDVTTKKYKCQIIYCRSKLNEAKNPKQKSQLHRHLREVHGIKAEGIKVPSTSQAGDLMSLLQKRGTVTTFEEKLVKFIVDTNQPFSIVEQPNFLSLFTDKMKGITRKTVKSKVLKMYEKRKAELRHELQGIRGKLSLIIDGWQSPNVYEFIGILASFIDDEWRLQIRALDFAVIEGRANSKELAKVVCQVLDDFQIANRIHAITVDNASVMDAMMNELSNLFLERDPPLNFNPLKQHIRCLNHVLNLSCQNALTALKYVKPLEEELDIGLEETDIADDGKDLEDDDTADQNSDNLTYHKEVLDGDCDDNDDEELSPALSPYAKIKKLVTKVRNSSTYHGEYVKIAKLFELKPLELIQDVSIRWNSTYLMLQRVLVMKEVIVRLVQKFPVFQKFMLSEEEWKLIEQIVDLLEPFNRHTLQLSREDTPTLSLAAMVYMELFNHLDKFKKLLGTASPRLLTDAIDRAEEKLGKYWEMSGYLAYALGLVLDPRTKLKWYKDVGLKDQVAIGKPMIEEHWRYFYKGVVEPTKSPEKESETSAYNLLKKQLASTKPSCSDEFTRFIKSSPESPDTDPLEWWKAQQSEFPNLSQMAKDAFGASATGTSIERKFSMGPMVITRLRSSLKPSTIRAVLCLKAWIKQDRQKYL